MKHLKSWLLLFVVMLFNFSFTPQEEQGVKFFNGTLTEAMKAIKDNPKGPQLIFVDCYTSWCGPCKMISTKVFPTKTAGDYLNANFVCLKMDMEKGEGPDTGKKYQIKGYPTFLILDKDGNEVARAMGGTADAQAFVNKIKSALEAAQKKD